MTLPRWLQADDDDVAFFVGLHQPSDAHRFKLVCISIRRLWKRRKPILNANVLVDSGAFTELNLYGKYRESVGEYARRLFDLYQRGIVRIAGAVAQDYMCEPFILAKTGMTIDEHQRLTIERYDDLIRELTALFGGEIPFHVMPVLQGFAPEDYALHIQAYGDRLKPGMWVGVGSVCKRQGSPMAIVEVLRIIKQARPDLRLHGFGVKTTSLMNRVVRKLLATADSMAWSFAARKQGRNANSWEEAANFVRRIADCSTPQQADQLEMAV